MSTLENSAKAQLSDLVAQARQRLDAHTVETVAWHFHESTGCPFWLENAKIAQVRSAQGDQELRRPEEVRAVQGRMAARRAGAALGAQGAMPTSRSTSSRPAARPACPRAGSRSRTSAPTIRCSARRCPTSIFPKGSNWLMLGPRARGGCGWRSSIWPSIRGGICFCIDLDPRWVIKLIKKGWMEHLEAYKQHCIDQAITILGAGHDIRCMFTTPKLLESLAMALEKRGTFDSRVGHHRHLFRRHRVHAAVDPLRHRRVSRRRLHDAHLRQHADGPGLLQAGDGREDGYKISYYAPQPRAVIEVVDFNDYDRVVGYGETGRVKLTTLTKEFFVPGFLERDEGEREQPYVQISLGRRQRRAAVPRIGRSHDRGRVLKDCAKTSEPDVRAALQEAIAMLNIPDPALGQALRVARSRPGRPLPDRRADRQGQPGQRRPAGARHAQGPAGPRRAAQIRLRRTDRARQEGRPSCISTPRCRWATASNRPTNSPASSRPRPACPSTCARATCRRTTSCSRTWSECSTR